MTDATRTALRSTENGDGTGISGGARSVRLRGPAASLARNMVDSLSVPTATTFRTFAVEDLLLWREAEVRRGKDLPLTAVIAFAIAQVAGTDVPAILNQYHEDGDGPSRRTLGVVNLGIAVDLQRRDGSRSVVVPVVKDAASLSFGEFVVEYRRLVDAVRNAALAVDDLQGANLLMTSTGKFGSTAGVPRLPAGPAAIIAVSSIMHPPGLSRLAESLPIDRILTLTSTYDHRVVQGADSGNFLGHVERRLASEEFRAAIAAAAAPVPVHADHEAASTRTVAVVDIDALPPSDAAQAWAQLNPLSGSHSRTPRVLLEARHLTAPRREWWIKRTALEQPAVDGPTCRWAGRLLCRADAFERYLQKQFLGQKTLSLEGIDSSLLAVAELAELAAEDSATDVVIGMAHRGRLNVMAHVLGWPYERILNEFESSATAGPQSTGDVRQHLGGTGTYLARSGHRVGVRLEQNPSHLEFVTPVALGAVRALQDAHADAAAPGEPGVRRAVVPVLLHGDAAFTGQGVVAETLNLAGLDAYNVGGAVHIVQDNQLGYTATARELRSTRWPSDLAKGFDVPVLHVNAEDVEAVLIACRLAASYRREVGADIVLHLVGYRRLGHNETDEPRYTQPDMYNIIDARKRLYESYAEELAAAGLLDPGEMERVWAETTDRLNAARESAAGFDGRDDMTVAPAIAPYRTNLSQAALAELADRLDQVPSGVSAHRKLVRQFDRRRKAFAETESVEWAQAEALALVTIADSGVRVRLTGEDTERGTFSHRHAVLHDPVTGAGFPRLAAATAGTMTVANSPLTETATIGYEYGLSRTAPHALVLWEAQFGDFVNVAQVMIDNFIAAGAQKWGRAARLTLLLPHGYEGSGPEHSSARLERFLQLGAGANLRVAQPTTAAQYFALLRDQAFTSTPAPLVVMTPKSLLRLPAAQSSLASLAADTFHPILWDDRPGPLPVRRLVLCSGRVYYDLQAALDSALGHARDQIALARVEQLHPFPLDEVTEHVAAMAELEEIVWVQDEPKNMGAWRHTMAALLESGRLDLPLGYLGRPEQASPAEGYGLDHTRNQQRVLQAALELGTADTWLTSGGRRPSDHRLGEAS